MARWVFLLILALRAVAATAPSDWVPARWYWTGAESLELLRGTPVNCLLVKSWDATLAAAAAGRGVALLAAVAPGADAVAQARRATADKLAGVVLEGDFPAETAASIREAAPGLAIIEMTARNRMRLDTAQPVAATYQGVWPGVQVLEGGAAKAAPTGSPWIDTNSGFLRAARAWGPPAIWLGNLPPEKTIVQAERYLQAIADAAMAGGRWVVALDGDLSARLGKREAAAVRDWKRMMELLAFFENHREWRAYRAWGKLAIVQDRDAGALLSGGILDMIAARHTPVRPVPGSKLTPEALAGATMAVNVDGEALPPERLGMLKEFARAGNTLMTPPAGKATLPPDNRITLDKAELERLGDIYKDVQSMVGRRNLGVRLFNVSSMLSNLLASADGSNVLLYLVNYSGYPVENVTVHLTGKFTRARLFTPEGAEKDLEVYPTEEGTGIDIARVSICAALRVD